VEVRVSSEPAVDAATWMARRLRDSVRRRSAATLAVSGGSTAPPLFGALLDHDVPWSSITIWQVDERVAPDGHTDRNVEQLHDLPATVRAMPVTSSDLRAAARRYAGTLPERFDLVHLGIGPDGHTASWPPGTEIARSTRPVEVTDVFNGRRRMTLTRVVVNAARARVVLTTGSDKADVVARWRDGDRTLPISLVTRTGTVAFVDPAAAGRAAQ
jgi:6-phosphogluconolactonase/glucosamine-6-phosphate isomerase/deaminase